VAEYSKFDRFDAPGYSQAYRADRVYQLLGELLERYVNEGMKVVDLGSGASVPVAVWMAQHRRGVELHLFEPSRMAEGAAQLLSQLSRGPYHLHRLAAHQLSQELPEGFDLLVCNRMLHEWRLADLERTGKWDLTAVLSQACSGLRPAGVVVMGDFAFPAGLAPERILASMEAMLERFGHTHPPDHFIQPESAAAALESAGLEILEEHRIERPEPDTDRFYWFLVARKLRVPIR
jgi:SAM-dependent methyltransferase